VSDGADLTWRAALAGADTVVWEWDIDSDELRDAQQSLAQLGYAPGQVGHTQADWDRLIHPDDRAANEAAYQRHARGEADNYEHSYRARDAQGRWRWLHERGRIVERHADGRPRRMVGIQTDITRQRDQQDAAQAATARLEKIAAHVPGVLYQFELRPDFRARFLYASAQLEPLMGVPTAVATSDATDVFAAVHRDDRAAMLQTVLASGRELQPWRHEFRVRRGDGQLLWLQGSASPQREADGRLVWHGYLQDITERRELEQARHDAAIAAAASRAKSEFLSRMSHELRTPLNAVLGFAQLMEIDTDEPPGPGQLRRLKHIRDAGDHLLQMIGELLDLTRIETGTLALADEAVPLRQLAGEAMAMVQAQALQAGVEVSLQVDGEPLARADRKRLRQVLLNLLSNAVKYNRGGGRVEVHAAVVESGHEADAERDRDGEGPPPAVWLQVRDNGVGIAEADLPRLFEPFHRGRQADGPIDGTGIGLSLSRSLVLLMGGRIEVASMQGVGSTFTVTLPGSAA
jgi:PAS domain S-box-containing protein